MTTLVGIIAEDKSDVAVIDIFISKITSAQYSAVSYVAGGCGKILGKCSGWAKNLSDRGCKLLIVVRDLDSGSKQEIYDALSKALKQSPIKPFIIVVPVREIESWLLADHNAIRRMIRAHKPIKAIANPERLFRPKEYLRDLIYRESNKKILYLHTVHNPRIAKECDVMNVRRCESFRPLQDFIVQNLRSRSRR